MSENGWPTFLGGRLLGPHRGVPRGDPTVRRYVREQESWDKDQGQLFE